MAVHCRSLHWSALRAIELCSLEPCSLADPTACIVLCLFSLIKERGHPQVMVGCRRMKFSSPSGLPPELCSLLSRSAVELARIVADTMDSMFNFSLRVPPATAQRLTDGIDAVVQKCVSHRSCLDHLCRKHHMLASAGPAMRLTSWFLRLMQRCHILLSSNAVCKPQRCLQ